MTECNKYRKSKTLMAGAILLLFILLGMAVSSCGPGYHLRRAQHHIRKAEFKGANIKTQTTIKKISLTAPKMEFSTKLADIIVNDTTIIQNKAGQEAKILVDTVTNTVYLECPEQDVAEEVPCDTTTNVSAPKGIMYYLGLFWWVVFGAFVIGGITGMACLARLRSFAASVLRPFAGH